MSALKPLSSFAIGQPLPDPHYFSSEVVRYNQRTLIHLYECPLSSKETKREAKFQLFYRFRIKTPVPQELKDMEPEWSSDSENSPVCNALTSSPLRLTSLFKKQDEGEEDSIADSEMNIVGPKSRRKWEGQAPPSDFGEEIQEKEITGVASTADREVCKDFPKSRDEGKATTTASEAENDGSKNKRKYSVITRSGRKSMPMEEEGTESDETGSSTSDIPSSEYRRGGAKDLKIYSKEYGYRSRRPKHGKNEDK